jgi:hypothetical protein
MSGKIIIINDITLSCVDFVLIKKGPPKEHREIEREKEIEESVELLSNNIINCHITDPLSLPSRKVQSLEACELAFSAIW